MKLYLTALILGTCLVLAGCPAKEPVGETDETNGVVTAAGPDKTKGQGNVDVVKSDD